MRLVSCYPSSVPSFVEITFKSSVLNETFLPESAGYDLGHEHRFYQNVPQLLITRFRRARALSGV